MSATASTTDAAKTGNTGAMGRRMGGILTAGFLQIQDGI